MRSIVLVALLAAACQSPQKLPDGTIDTQRHQDYAQYRPVTIAVLPVDAPVTTLRTDVRK